MITNTHTGQRQNAIFAQKLRQRDVITNLETRERARIEILSQLRGTPMLLALCRFELVGCFL